MLDHGLFNKPGPALSQGLFVKILICVDNHSRLFEREIKGVKKGIDLGDNEKTGFIKEDIPVGAGGEGVKFVIPLTLGAGKIVVVQPADSGRQIVGFFYLGLAHCCASNVGARLTGGKIAYIYILYLYNFILSRFSHCRGRFSSPMGGGQDTPL